MLSLFEFVYTHNKHKNRVLIVVYWFAVDLASILFIYILGSLFRFDSLSIAMCWCVAIRQQTRFICLFTSQFFSLSLFYHCTNWSLFERSLDTFEFSIHKWCVWSNDQTQCFGLQNEIFVFKNIICNTQFEIDSVFSALYKGSAFYVFMFQIDNTFLKTKYK